MAIVALAVAWWVDRTRLVDQLAAERERQGRFFHVHWSGDLSQWTVNQAMPELLPVEVQIEPVETFYSDDLPAFFEQLKKG
jgi:hypothetical protein